MSYFRFEFFTEDQIESSHNAALHKHRQHIIRAPGVEQIFYRQIHIRIIYIRMTEAECGGNSGKKCNNNQQQPGKCKRLSADRKNLLTAPAQGQGGDLQGKYGVLRSCTERYGESPMHPISHELPLQ